MGDERYEANYALSTLRMQLRKSPRKFWSAAGCLVRACWQIFRAVFGGIEHENLRLPALGWLAVRFPDRFPFLEGRAKAPTGAADAAKPLPIDNRTVLLLLEAIQQFSWPPHCLTAHWICRTDRLRVPERHWLERHQRQYIH